MQPNNRPILDPRMSHRRPVVPTAELDRMAAAQTAPAQDTSAAAYGSEVTVGGLSSRPARRAPDRGMRLLVIIAVVVVMAAVGLFVVSRLTGAGGGDDVPADNSSGGATADDERRADINALASAIQLYAFNNSGQYPTSDQLNDGAWRNANMPELQNESLIDPKGTYAVLETSAGADSYAYIVSAATKLSEACDNQTVMCERYQLIATLSDGSLYTLH